jgi:hypothetical protein
MSKHFKLAPSQFAFHDKESSTSTTGIVSQFAKQIEAELSQASIKVLEAYSFRPKNSGGRRLNRKVQINVRLTASQMFEEVLMMDVINEIVRREKFKFWQTHANHRSFSKPPTVVVSLVN